MGVGVGVPARGVGVGYSRARSIGGVAVGFAVAVGGTVALGAGVKVGGSGVGVIVGNAGRGVSVAGVISRQAVRPSASTISAVRGVRREVRITLDYAPFAAQ